MSASPSDPLVGAVLGGRYEVVVRRFRGGMGVVYEGQDLRLDRKVAIKVMHENLCEGEDFARKFDREARSTAGLSHPNIVSVFDQGQDRGRPYIVMELVNGTTLRNVISESGPLAPRRAMEMMLPVLAALSEAHRSRLVHCDVKPENVLISDSGQVKVADFGLARAISVHSQSVTAGVLVGTVSYLPPEVAQNAKPDARCDVYSSGVMLYEMLTGKKPFIGDTPVQVIYAHCNSRVPLPSLSAGRGAIPDYLDALVETATQRDPALRFADAETMLHWTREVTANLEANRASNPHLAAEIRQQAAPMAKSPVEPERAEDAAAPYPEPPVEHTPQDLKTSALPGYRVSQDEVHKRRRKMVAIIALIVLLLGAAGAYGAYWYATVWRYTSAPQLVHLTKPQAEKAAGEAQVKVAFEMEYSETEKAGQITRSEPTANQKVLKGSTVRAWISKGAERYEVPRVAGMSIDEATGALTKQKLELGKVTKGWSESAPVGKVIASSPKAGEQVKPKTKVNLVVSKGPKPIPIPDLTGKPMKDAIAQLKKLGFEPSQEGEAYSATAPKGSVASQTPKSGTGKAGDTVTLTLSKGPEMVTVPNTWLLSAAKAQAKLQAAGFKVKIVQPTGSFPVYRVGKTDPKGGSKAPKGSLVTVYLS